MEEETEDQVVEESGDCNAQNTGVIQEEISAPSDKIGTI